MTSLLLRLLALYLGGAPLYAQTVGATSLLTRGPGAEAAALSGAVVPTIADPTALYWNPAGLAHAGGAVTGENLFLYDTARYDFVGLSVPSQIGTFGLGALQLNRGNIIARSAVDDPGTTVSNTQSDYMIGYGRSLAEHVTAGATANVLDFNEAGNADKGFGFDAGTQASYPSGDFGPFKRPMLSLGAVVKNLLAPKLKLNQDEEIFPRELRGGAGLSFQAFSRASNLGVIRFDRLQTLFSFRRTSGDPSFHLGLGVAYSFENLMIIRAGFDGLLSGGVGFRTSDQRFALDYALENGPLAMNHRFTLSYRFNPAPTQAYAAASEEIDDEYARAKGQSEALAQEDFTAGMALFKDRRYAEALEPLEQATYLEPGNGEVTESYRRAVEVRRREVIHSLSDALGVNMAPGKEADAYRAVADLLDLKPDNEAQLVAIAKRLPERIDASTFTALSQAVFLEKSVEIQRLIDAGMVADALSLTASLEITASTQTAPQIATLKEHAAARGAMLRKDFDGSSLVAGHEPGAHLVRAARAVARAFPDDPKASTQAIELREAYKSRLALSVKERFYLRKLYYLAAVRFAKQQFGEARDLLDEILRRDAADEDANTLLDAMTRKGMTQVK
jgi:tetratricopeptide (TPR) repeat protein